MTAAEVVERNARADGCTVLFKTFAKAVAEQCEAFAALPQRQMAATLDKNALPA